MSSLNISMIFIVSFGTAVLSSKLFAHGNKKHAEPGSSPKVIDAPDYNRDINLSFQKSVKPIFDQKCANCHSSQTLPPWYGSLPGIGRIISADRSEAQEHLEISKGFPFSGHGSPEEDLDSIREAVEKGLMPTRLYRLVHWSSGLTGEEKAAVLNWVEESKNRIEKSKKDMK